MKILIDMMVVIFIILLVGCDEGRFSDNNYEEVVSVDAYIPQNIEMLPLKIMYRSSSCPKSRVGGKGEKIIESGYHLMQKKFISVPGGDVLKLSVPRFRGGRCQWKLSNIMIGYTLKEMPSTGDEKLEYIPSTEVIVFDDNYPQLVTGPYVVSDGDLKLEKDYFPMITRRRALNSYLEYSIVKASPAVIYKSTFAKKITFRPNIHLTEILRADESPVHKVGEYISVTYPDGTCEKSPYFPDYKKLRELLKKQPQLYFN